MRSVVLLVITTCLLISAYVLCNRVDTIQFRTNTSQYLLNEETSNTYSKVLSGGEVLCDRASLSNLVLALESEGYTLDIRESSDKALDLVLSKDDITLRLFYGNNGVLESFSDPYEKCSEVISYINESRD